MTLDAKVALGFSRQQSQGQRVCFTYSLAQSLLGSGTRVLRAFLEELENVADFSRRNSAEAPEGWGRVGRAGSPGVLAAA